MLFQDVPPDTSVYMLAGYTVFFVLLAAYLLSLSIRGRNLKRDLERLEALAHERRPPASRPKTSARPAARRRAGHARKK